MDEPPHGVGDREPHDPGLTDEPLAWAVRKGDTALLQQLNAELEVMRRNGTLQEILGRWLKTRVLVGLPSTTPNGR